MHNVPKWSEKLLKSSHPIKVPKLTETLTGAENCPNPRGNLHLTIRSRKCIECDIMWIAR